MNKPTTAFWIIAVIALIWNLMGAFAFVTDMNMSDDLISMLEKPLQDLRARTPMWNNIAYGVATIGGLLGAIALVLRKQLSRPLFLVSLAGIIGNMIWNLFLSGATDVLPSSAFILPIFVILIGVFLVWFSGDAGKKGLLS